MTHKCDLPSYPFREEPLRLLSLGRNLFLRVRRSAAQILYADPVDHADSGHGRA